MFPTGLTTTALAVASALLVCQGLALPAAAQSPDYFIPGQQRQAAPPRPGAQRPATRPTPAQPQQPQMPMPTDLSGGPGADANQPMPQMPMPAVPQLPPLPKGSTPPPPVVGVIGVPELMRASTAAQQIDRVIGERREKLNADAQKEQAAWRDLQQTLANQRGTLSPDQIRSRERELQERITNAQRQFRERNMIIQEAAQFALNQLQASMIAVIRQVAESHGMNLVLHRSQVALNISDLDITDQVQEQVNKVQPTVTIPADGVSPLTLPPVAAAPGAAVVAAPAPAAAPAATPAAVPAKPAPSKP